MAIPNFVILYVDQPLASADFYASLFGRPALEAAPTFAMFALDNGLMLGLWDKRGVQPAAEFSGASGELAFALEDDAAVDVMFAQWSTRGLSMLQTPVRMDFGYTFVARDPDGHRLRVFAPGAP